MWTNKFQSKSQIVVTLYWGGTHVHRVCLQNNGEYCIGEYSNIGMSFPHPQLNLSIVGHQLWLEQQPISHPLTRQVWSLVDGETVRCVLDFQPKGQSLWVKQQGGFMILFAALIVLMAWADAIHRFQTNDSLPIVARLDWSPVNIRNQAYMALNSDVGFNDRYFHDAQSGPQHQTDDALSRVAYYPWYRSQVQTAGLLPQLLREHLQDSDNPSSHWMLGLYAYAADDPKLALWHFYQVEQLTNNDHLQDERLYWTLLSYRRLGYHQQELDLASQLLKKNKGSLSLQMALANVQIRLRNFAAAEDTIRSIETVSDHHLLVEYLCAQIHAVKGENTAAIERLRHVLMNFDSFSHHNRTEIIRDLSIDPIFSELRKGNELRNMLVQFYGSDAPQRIKSFSD